MSASSIFGSGQDTTDARNAQSGHSVNVAGPLSTGATDNAVALGAAARLQVKNLATGSTDLESNKGQIGGVSVSGRGAALSTTDNSTTTITSADPTVAAQAINAVADVSKQFGNQLSDFLNKTGQQSSATLQTALGSIGSLSQGQQAQTAATTASAATGGVSNYFKPALIGLAIVALVIIAVFWKKK